MEEMTLKQYIESLPDLKKDMIKRIAAETMSSEVSVYRWINGDTTPHPLKQSIISRLVNIPVEILFPESRDNK